MTNLKLGLYMDIKGTYLSSELQVSDFVQNLPKPFLIRKFGTSEIARELHNFSGFGSKEYQEFMQKAGDYFHLRMNDYIFNWLLDHSGQFANISLRASAQKFEKKRDQIDSAWEFFTPDGAGFYHSYTGYSAHSMVADGEQSNSEYVQRYGITIQYPRFHAETGDFLGNVKGERPALRYLDLLPGLMWRIGMGEHHFEKYNISPEEISKVCVSTEETTAANGDKLWKFQSREDPLDWRDSYERQLKLNRPDVFFDIAPLRKRFADPVDIKDSGRGDELDKLFKRALIELYPESATRGIKV